MHIDTLRGYCACCDMKMSGISVLNYISRFLSANFNLIAYVPNKSSDQIGNWNLLNPEITLYRHQNDPFFTAYLMIEFHIIFESTTCWFSDREIRSQRNVLRYSCTSFSVHCLTQTKMVTKDLNKDSRWICVIKSSHHHVCPSLGTFRDISTNTTCKVASDIFQNSNQKSICCKLTWKFRLVWEIFATFL